jgi:hypothetical protein
MAGCAGEATSGPSSDTQTGGRSVVQDVAVDAGYLVVRLREDHDVTGVTLIAPDGTLFTEHSVAVGVTTVRLELLDIQPGLGGYDHYEPGEYELVAVRDQESVRVPVDLQPDLRIVSVRQYRDGDRPSDLGKLVVEVENVGTGPTWVHDITYRDAPNWTANDPLTEDPSIPQIEYLSESNQPVIAPDKMFRYLAPTPPLLFSSPDFVGCSGSAEFYLLVGVAEGEQLEQRVVATLDGQKEDLALIDQYACTAVSAELPEEEPAQLRSRTTGGRT